MLETLIHRADWYVINLAFLVAPVRIDGLDLEHGCESAYDDFLLLRDHKRPAMLLGEIDADLIDCRRHCVGHEPPLGRWHVLGVLLHDVRYDWPAMLLVKVEDATEVNPLI